MQHIVIPEHILTRLLVNPDEAFINDQNTQMFTMIDGTLHVLVGDFTGIETAENLADIVRRNLT